MAKSAKPAAHFRRLEMLWFVSLLLCKGYIYIYIYNILQLMLSTLFNIAKNSTKSIYIYKIKHVGGLKALRGGGGSLLMLTNIGVCALSLV